MGGLNKAALSRATVLAGKRGPPVLSIQYGAHSEALPSPSGVMTAEGFFNYGPHSISSIAQQD